jgi:hypothetical protein
LSALGQTELALKRKRLRTYSNCASDLVEGGLHGLVRVALWCSLVSAARMRCVRPVALGRPSNAESYRLSSPHAVLFCTVLRITCWRVNRPANQGHFRLLPGDTGFHARYKWIGQNWRHYLPTVTEEKPCLQPRQASMPALISSARTTNIPVKSSQQMNSSQT